MVGSDGNTTLSMQREEASHSFAASINDFNNKILYQIVGDEADDELVITQIPLEDMLDEADVFVPPRPITGPVQEKFTSIRGSSRKLQDDTLTSWSYGREWRSVRTLVEPKAVP